MNKRSILQNICADIGRLVTPDVRDRTEGRLRQLRAASRQLLLALARERDGDMPNLSMELRQLASSDRA